MAEMTLKGETQMPIPSDIRNLRTRIRSAIQHFASSGILARSGILSRVVFMLDGGFRREVGGVVAGRRRYWEASNSDEETQYRLRRNIHRLEKGLIQKDRRAVFALDYITDTVEGFERVLGGSAGEVREGSELAWARDVLEEYFACTESSPQRDHALSRFQPIMNRRLDQPPDEGMRLIPYHRNSAGDQPPISYEDFLSLTLQRRSVRWFEQTPVPRELVDKALAAAAQSPSACNRQPFEFRIFDEPSEVRRVAQIPGGTVGYYENFPAVAVIVGDLGAFFSPRDRHVVYIDASLAAMTFMLALETLGLSSCPINWPDVTSSELQMREMLSLGEHQRVVMLVAFGYPDPDGLVARSQKRPLEQLRRYNWHG